MFRYGRALREHLAGLEKMSREQLLGSSGGLLEQLRVGAVSVVSKAESEAVRLSAKLRALLEPPAPVDARPSSEVPSVLDASARYDLLTTRIMERVLRPDSNALDIGANIGDILSEIVRIAPNGHHHAFEPIPALNERLRQRFPSVEVHALALSDSAGETEFRHVKNAEGYSGLKERHYDSVVPEIELLRVKIQRLDDVIPEDLPVQLIKADVEGGEYNVFQGAARTLRRWKPYIIFEHGMGSAEFYGVTPEMMFGYLTTFGYRVSRLADFLDGAPALDVVQIGKLFRSGAEWMYVAHPGEIT